LSVKLKLNICLARSLRLLRGSLKRLNLLRRYRKRLKRNVERIKENRFPSIKTKGEYRRVMEMAIDVDDYIMYLPDLDNKGVIPFVLGHSIYLDIKNMIN